jgi:hypothetical protein
MMFHRFLKEHRNVKNTGADEGNRPEKVYKLVMGKTMEFCKIPPATHKHHDKWCVPPWQLKAKKN